MELTKSNLKKSCLSFSNKQKKVDSPKTPKQNVKLYNHAENATSEASPSLNTPESCRFLNNVFIEESPTQNYYEHCTLSQKMLIDEDRDVIWNWHENENKINLNNNFKISNEPYNKKTTVLKNLENNAKKKKKLKISSEGLYKLQALQEAKKIENNYNKSGKSLLNCSKENADPGKGESECSFLKYNNNANIKFDDEEDSFLYQLSQTFEKYNSKTEILPIIDSMKFDFKSKIINNNSPIVKKNISSAILKKSARTSVIKDKCSSLLENEDSFDDIFLSIDLSSINDNKKYQFQRHNSMPSDSGREKTDSKNLMRHGSASDFCKRTLQFEQKKRISAINRLNDFSKGSLLKIESIKDSAIHEPSKRCSKAEVEAKRLEAKRKRLLKVNTNFTK